MPRAGSCGWPAQRAVAGRGYRFAGEVQDLAAGADALAVDAPLPAVIDDSCALELDELHDRLRGTGVLLISARADLGFLLRMNGVETPAPPVSVGTAYHESAVAQGLMRRLTVRSAQPSIDRSHEDESRPQLLHPRHSADGPRGPQPPHGPAGTNSHFDLKR
jgi:hypothetical protein